MGKKEFEARSASRRSRYLRETYGKRLLSLRTRRKVAGQLVHELDDDD